MKRILVCGGRKYADAATVNTIMDRLAAKQPFMLIEGGAAGADQLARSWALAHKNPYATVPAHWEKLGNQAGPIRNSWMLILLPDMVVAFPGGDGTEDMVDKALHANIETFRVSEDGKVSKAVRKAA